MVAKYRTIPHTALNKSRPFRISIPESDIQDLRTLLKLSKIPAPTYESLQEDGRFGVSHKWLTETKKYWEDQLNWQVFLPPLYRHDNLMSRAMIGESVKTT